MSDTNVRQHSMSIRTTLTGPR
uniref:Uncharacterized protein n=1 Tax=Anguilla anguilla TaxID=7936 RepID=A0A0E9RPS4_ANGAN